MPEIWIMYVAGITNRSNISACKCYEKAGGINDADDEVVYVYDFREEN